MKDLINKYGVFVLVAWAIITLVILVISCFMIYNFITFRPSI